MTCGCACSIVLGWVSTRRFTAPVKRESLISPFDLTRVSGIPRVLLARGGRSAGRRAGIPGATRKPSSGVMRAPQDSGGLVHWRYGKIQGSAKFFGAELTTGWTRSKLAGLPRILDESPVLVCVRFLRTQQRVKSQCIYMYYPRQTGLSGPVYGYSHGFLCGWVAFPGVFVVPGC